MRAKRGKIRVTEIKNPSCILACIRAERPFLQHHSRKGFVRYNHAAGTCFVILLFAWHCPSVTPSPFSHSRCISNPISILICIRQLCFTKGCICCKTSSQGRALPVTGRYQHWGNQWTQSINHPLCKTVTRVTVVSKRTSVYICMKILLFKIY